MTKINAVPWICPKCGRVYGPQVTQCYSCNSKIDKKRTVPWERPKNYKPWIAKPENPPRRPPMWLN